MEAFSSPTKVIIFWIVPLARSPIPPPLPANCPICPASSSTDYSSPWPMSFCWRMQMACKNFGGNRDSAKRRGSKRPIQICFSWRDSYQLRLPHHFAFSAKGWAFPSTLTTLSFRVVRSVSENVRRNPLQICFSWRDSYQLRLPHHFAFTAKGWAFPSTLTTLSFRVVRSVSENVRRNLLHPTLLHLNATPS